MKNSCSKKKEFSRSPCWHSDVQIVVPKIEGKFALSTQVFFKRTTLQRCYVFTLAIRLIK